MFVELGSRRQGEADQFGLRGVDPRDASTWDGSIRDDEKEEFPNVEHLPAEQSIPGEEHDEDFWRDGFSADENGDGFSVEAWDEVEGDHTQDNGGKLEFVITK